MSGHTAACRALYSGIRSGLTWSWKQTRGIDPAPSWSGVWVGRVVLSISPGPGGRGPDELDQSRDDSEVEVVDVGLVEGVRLAQEDDTVGADVEGAEVARF